MAKKLARKKTASTSTRKTAPHLRAARSAGQAGTRPSASGRIRRPGAGRKRRVEQDVTLRTDLERLVEPLTRGDPETPLRWTCESLRHLAEELAAQGHHVSRTVVGALLSEMGYSLQANAKTLEGTDHPDRNAQFEHINREVQARLAHGEGVTDHRGKDKGVANGPEEPVQVAVPGRAVAWSACTRRGQRARAAGASNEQRGVRPADASAIHCTRVGGRPTPR